MLIKLTFIRNIRSDQPLLKSLEDAADQAAAMSSGTSTSIQAYISFDQGWQSFCRKNLG